MAHGIGRGRYKTETYPSPPTSGSGGNARPFVWWRPDGTGTAKTWADVIAKLGNLPLGVIYCDQQFDDETGYVVDVGTFNLRNAVFQSPIDGEIQISVPEGAVLDNWGGAIGQAEVSFSPTTTTPLTFSGAAASNEPVGSFQLSFGADAFNEGEIPLVIVDGSLPPGAIEALAIYLDNGGQLIGSASARIANVINNGEIAVFVTNNSPNDFPVSDQAVGGDATGIAIIVQDGSVPTPPPTTIAPLIGFSNEATSTVGGAGPTSFRPSGVIPVGCIYYDTTIPQYVFWDGAAFVPL